MHSIKQNVKQYSTEQCYNVYIISKYCNITIFYVKTLAEMTRQLA